MPIAVDYWHEARLKSQHFRLRAVALWFDTCDETNTRWSKTHANEHLHGHAPFTDGQHQLRNCCERWEIGCWTDRCFGLFNIIELPWVSHVHLMFRCFVAKSCFCRRVVTGTGQWSIKADQRMFLHWEIKPAHLQTMQEVLTVNNL